MDKEILIEILKKHKKKLNGEKGGEFADLRYANLMNENLMNVDLRYANLSNADSMGADLRYADLRDADLTGTDLTNADLRNADLTGTDLTNADLTGANLTGANLMNVNLKNTNLRNANLDCLWLPLYCERLSANFDDKQLNQIAYFLVKAGLQSKNASKKTKAELEKLIDFANEFYKADEYGKIERKSNMKCKYCGEEITDDYIKVENTYFCLPCYEEMTTCELLNELDINKTDLAYFYFDVTKGNVKENNDCDHEYENYIDDKLCEEERNKNEI